MQQPTTARTPGADAVRAAQNARASAELAALDLRRAELKGQLESTTERRALLRMTRNQSADEGTRGALDGQIKALDSRTIALNAQLSEVDDGINRALAEGGSRNPSGFDQLMSSAFAPKVATTPPSGGLFGQHGMSDLGKIMAGQGVGFLLIAFVLWRWLSRRGTRLAPVDAQRLTQLQNAVDTMAVEVERISEGQRYVVKALGAGAAQEFSPARGEQQPVNASAHDR